MGDAHGYFQILEVAENRFPLVRIILVAVRVFKYYLSSFPIPRYGKKDNISVNGMFKAPSIFRWPPFSKNEFGKYVNILLSLFEQYYIAQFPTDN